MLRMIIAVTGAASLATLAFAWAATAASQVADSAPSPAAVSVEKLFGEECGACHMAYPPQFLPARSWQAIMQALPRHFGENAGLDPEAARKIREYLAANAADAHG